MILIQNSLIWKEDKKLFLNIDKYRDNTEFQLKFEESFKVIAFCLKARLTFFLNICDCCKDHMGFRASWEGL